MKNGSCATGNRESCQVGNQAALSGHSGVPQGSLFGALHPESACKGLFEVRVYGSLRTPDGGCAAEEQVE